MAACDVTEKITNAVSYRSRNLGGVKIQKAMKAYALCVLNQITATDASYAASIASAVGQLGAVDDDMVRAGEINILFAAAIRNGLSPASTLQAKMNEVNYMAQLDDKTLDRWIEYLMCSWIVTFIP